MRHPFITALLLRQAPTAAASELSADCQRPGAGSGQPGRGRAESPPGSTPRPPQEQGRLHVETHPRARAEGHAGGAERAWHGPVDPPVPVEGAPLGMHPGGCWQLIRWPAVAERIIGMDWWARRLTPAVAFSPRGAVGLRGIPGQWELLAASAGWHR
jgi:hypothetical protein